MLYKLSLANIKKSFKDYAIYFITLILGVCIFYVFNSMDSQTAMIQVTSSKRDMIKIMTEALSYVSVFVSFILGFLIIYASRFLIKKRNKEFGIYMTLGMSKRKISFILLIETFIIGLISLGVGLLLGVFVSQITSIFVANMFEADMTKFTFNFSSAAMIKTMIYFGIIYFIVMIFNTIIVSKNKLINLLQASKRQENIRIKNPIVCIILFIVSCLLLGRAYYMVSYGVEELFTHKITILLVPISIGIIGTVLFFYSVAGMVLRVLSKCHNIYFKKLNSFTFKQLNSKINTMVISMSVICLMLFVTLCLLSSALTIKDYFNNSINKYAPADFELVGYYNDTVKNFDLGDFVESDNKIKENVHDLVNFDVYEDDNFKFFDSFGSYKDELFKKNPFLNDGNFSVSIMMESDYNKLANIFKLDTVDLNDDEYVIVTNYGKEYYEGVVKNNCVLNIFGHDLKSHGNLIDGFMFIAENPSNMGFFVVSDSIVDKEDKIRQVLVGNYDTKNEDVINYIEDKVQHYSDFGYEMVKSTKIELKDGSVGLSAIATFIGLYLGIIFLISSSAILALKQLSDSIDDKNKYKVLRQIGADETDINKSLFKQTLIFFIMPLALAIFHTYFGLKFCTEILKSIGITNLFSGFIFTGLFLIIIYGIYFVVTYLCSKNIIKEKN